MLVSSRLRFRTAALLLALVPAAAQTIRVDAAAPGSPFPHFWERMFGSGRAILSLRDSYRRDLRATKAATDFEFVRFHAIFHDEVGLYGEDAQGHPTYNFSYIDEIYDGLRENGVRPTFYQQRELRQAGQIPAPELRALGPGNITTLKLTLAPHCLALVQVVR